MLDHQQALCCLTSSTCLLSSFIGFQWFRGTFTDCWHHPKWPSKSCDILWHLRCEFSTTVAICNCLLVKFKHVYDFRMCLQHVIMERYHVDDMMQIHAKFSADTLLNHWGGVTLICVTKLPTIGSGNGLSPGRRQAIIWTNAGILSIGSLGTTFSEIVIEIDTFSFKKMHLKMLLGYWRPFFLASMC